MSDRYKTLLACALSAAMLLSGCAPEDGGQSTQAGGDSQASALAASPADLSSAASDKVKSEDLDASWEEGSSTLIALDGDSASVAGSGASAQGAVVTISAAGTYVARGTLADGQIVIDAPETALVRLVLDGASIACSTTAPIDCRQADKLVVILAEGTENTLADSGAYVFPEGTDEPSAALFSKADLTLSGTGTLTVQGSYNNGIGTKDDLIIVSGTYLVTAANHAIRGRDSVTVLGGAFELEAGNDGIQANNDSGEDKGWIELHDGSYTIVAQHDGIQAEQSLLVAGGEYHITAGGGSANAPQRATQGPGGRGSQGAAPQTEPTETVTGEGDSDAASTSYKGLKAGSDLVVTGGVLTIDSADDALHANGNVAVSGGKMRLSTGDDGIHADGDLAVGGDPVIEILTSYEGIEGATVTISGGEIAIVASDDGVNAAGGAGGAEGGMFGPDRFNSASSSYFILVTGGNLTVTAGSDGLDSNGALTIEGGTVTLQMTNPNGMGGDGMLDADGAVTITGGVILGAGGNGIVTMGPGSADGESDTGQPVLQVYYTQTQGAGTAVELKDSAGNTAASFAPETEFKCVLISAPALSAGADYTLYTGGEETVEVTLSQGTTSVQDTGEAVSNNMGMPGGGRGQMPGGMPDRGQMPGGMPDRGQMPEGMPERGQMPEGGWGQMPENPPEDQTQTA